MQSLTEQLGLPQDLQPVKMQLVGLDGNAFSLLGAFRKEARKQGWDVDSIGKVSSHAISGDYNNLIATLVQFTEADEEEDEWDDDGYAVDEDGYYL